MTIAKSFHPLDPVPFDNGVGQEPLAHGFAFGLRAGPIVPGQFKLDELPHPHILHGGIAQRAEGVQDSLALGVQDASLQADGDLGLHALSSSREPQAGEGMKAKVSVSLMPRFQLTETLAFMPSPACASRAP